MYFSLHSLFPLLDIVLQTLLFPFKVTPFGDLWEQRYANKFVLDHFVSFRLDKWLIFYTSAHKFLKQFFFNLKYVLLSYWSLSYLSKLLNKLFD